jgi:hypothetical protein
MRQEKWPVRSRDLREPTGHIEPDYMGYIPFWLSCGWTTR